MKTFISAALLSLMLMGCGGGTDKILVSQEETNVKIDSLISFLNEPEEPEELTRKDFIIALFDSLVAYVYLTTQIDADPEAEDHGHTDVRYVEYYVFQLNKSDLYDGEFEFKRHLMADAMRKLEVLSVPPPQPISISDSKAALIKVFIHFLRFMFAPFWRRHHYLIAANNLLTLPHQYPLTSLHQSQRKAKAAVEFWPPFQHNYLGH